MKIIIFITFLFYFILNVNSQDNFPDKNSFMMLKFSTIEEADSCVKVFYEEGIDRDIIESDGEFYVEIEKDEIKMRSVNHKGYAIPRKWIKNNFEYFEVLKIGESSIGEGFIN